MKASQPTALARSLEGFFRDYLPTQRGMSLHSIRSYRDALILYLRYTAEHTQRPIEKLDLEQFTAQNVTDFLAHLERDRGNGVATRNARLAALHTLARYLASRHPERLAELQRILGVPFKRGGRQAPLEYLEQHEVAALLASVDRGNRWGQRDYALLALMFNTGARVQEIIDLRRRDIRTDPPHHVRLHGKGNKTRTCPIWPSTAALIAQLSQHTPHGGSDTILFTNQRGGQLTRYGVRHILHKYVTASIPTTATLRGKRIHPHTVRHTTAIHLLKAGVDFATISQWLGHATLNTTMTYARADLDTKRQALTQVFPDHLAPNSEPLPTPPPKLTDWLKTL